MLNVKRGEILQLKFVHLDMSGYRSLMMPEYARKLIGCNRIILKQKCILAAAQKCNECANSVTANCSVVQCVSGT